MNIDAEARERGYRNCLDWMLAEPDGYWEHCHAEAERIVREDLDRARARRERARRDARRARLCGIRCGVITALTGRPPRKRHIDGCPNDERCTTR